MIGPPEGDGDSERADSFHPQWLVAAQTIVALWRDEIATPKRAVYLINVCGPAGIGKTSLSSALQEVIGSNRCSVVNLDGWMMDRELRRPLGVSGMHPKAQKFDEAIPALTKIVQKQTARVPWYNHVTGTRGGFVDFSPPNVVIIEGTTAFYEQYLAFADRGIYLSMKEVDLFCRAVSRDVRERNYTLDGAIENFRRHYADYKKFLFPVSFRADIRLNIEVASQFRVQVGGPDN